MKLRSDSQSSLVTKQSKTTTALESVHRLRQVDAELSSQNFLNRAFVVNFRRLLELQKIFAVLHELIRSTAIAALTLVAAGNKWQCGYSCIFVAILLCLYAFHAAHYDSMDISDYRQLVDLLEDDDGCTRNGRTIDNPNRLLKALAVSRRGRRRRSTATIASFGSLCAAMWFVVVSIWADMDFYDWAEEMKDDFYATLLLVGTFMLGFIVAFDWIYWRETQCVLPFYDAANGVPFDPHKHGIPRGYRWLGLPSMWFTSQEAYDDLRLWITRAQQHGGAELDSDDPRAVEEVSVSRHGKIYPEEMAIFALDGGGCLLRNALLHAKLYSNRSRNFMTRVDTEDGKVRPIRKGEEPEELGVRLLLFDSSSREYLEPEEGYSEGQVHLLGRYGTEQSLPSLLLDS